MLRALVLVLMLLVASSLPARAGDEAPSGERAGIKARASALATQVEELKATFRDLADRLGALEKALDREEAGKLDSVPKRRPKKAKPSPKAEDEQPEKADPESDAESDSGDDATGDETDEGPSEETPEPEDGVDPLIAELVGTYSIDMALFLEAMSDFIREQLTADLGDVPDEIIDGAIAAVREQLEGVRFELALSADMTFVATSTLDGEPTEASGTWERDGEEVKLHQTHEDGEETDEPYDLTGLWDGEVLRLQPDEQLPVELVLNRV